MVVIRWSGRNIAHNIRHALVRRWQCLRLVVVSLFHNHFTDQGYIGDTLMEPMFWFVDNFTKFLGPFFVAGVVVLTSAVVYIAHTIGLAFWWNKSPPVTCVLIAFGYWLLVNITFNFYMAVTTSPGYPPQGMLIPEAVSICKKCVSPKPPRTHHCSVCDRCVLKMDHHCPWLNNCVGHYNHRYFYMYMAFMTLGTFYLMVFGVQLAYLEIWLDGWWDIPEDQDVELVGHPVRINQSQVIPVMEVMKNGSFHAIPEVEPPRVHNKWQRKALIFASLIVTGVFFALGSLTVWHYKLISNGESSIEAHINKSETKRLAALGKVYENPYDFGRRKNWYIFLGMVNGRGWRHILLPSAHKPEGSGLSWNVVTSLQDLEFSSAKVE